MCLQWTRTLFSPRLQATPSAFELGPHSYSAAWLGELRNNTRDDGVQSKPNFVYAVVYLFFIHFHLLACLYIPPFPPSATLFFFSFSSSLGTTISTTINILQPHRPFPTTTAWIRVASWPTWRGALLSLHKPPLPAGLLI